MGIFKRRFFNRISLLLIMSLMIFHSCEKDKELIQLPIKVFILGNTNVLHYSYDSQDRLVEIDSEFSLQQIDYDENKISKWTIEEYQSSDTSEHFYYYSNNLIDSIRYTNPSYYETELNHYIHDGTTYYQKLTYKHGVQTNTSIYEYESGRIISETFIMHESSNWEINYTFKYDELGNLTKVFHTDFLYREYEYSDKLNPLFKISKPYLEKTPIGFKEISMYIRTNTKYLVTREKEYSSDGTLQNEVIYEYTFNDNQQPTHASIEYNNYYMNNYGTAFYKYEY